MSRSFSRRRFVAGAAATAGAVAFPNIVTRNVLGANERLNIAAIGAGGKGAVDVDLCSTENIVALCDVDQRNAAKTFQRFDKAAKYTDFRRMLEKENRQIDAVTVSTPDHLHAVAAAMAIRLGKHVYCQKPMTHTVSEARTLTRLAREHKVTTQMGNQGHCHPGSRRLVELIRAGVLGEVKEIHVWTDRPIWPQGIDRPASTPPIPSTLDWDLWLGPAPHRPYHPAYVPFKWRGWWDFGTGAIGDMGCHNMDLAFWSLDLRDPTAVEAVSAPVNDETAPLWSAITWHFPRRGDRPAVPLTWYDGTGRQLPTEQRERFAAILAGKFDNVPNNGTIMVGTKDTLFVPFYWGSGSFVSGRTMEDFAGVPESLPRMPNGADNDRAHHQEWIAACKGEREAQSSFDYAGPMTEAALLGNVAVRLGKRIEWDAKAMKVTNAPEAERIVNHHYRKGWAL